MNDLICEDILSSRIAQAAEYSKSIGVPVRSGMAADVNGFSWGYGDCLYENGIINFYSCLHPHHGMFPLYKKYIPFYWETPKGNKLLVWNGEHYHFGNEMHFAPLGGTSYMTNDEYAKGVLYIKGEQDTEKKEMKFYKFDLKDY